MEQQGGQQDEQQPAPLHLAPELLGAEASDEEFTEASHSSSDEDEQAALGPAAATAAAVVAATAECPNGDEWSSMVALAQGYWQQGKIEKAINEYSALLRRSALVASGNARDRHRRAALLLLRSAAFADLSLELRSIPAAQSESRAIYAPDPCQLAALALKDADAAAAIQPEGDAAEAQLHRGIALDLLERYREAEAAYLAGLAVQPTHEMLLVRLREVREALADAGASPGAGADGGTAEGGAPASAGGRKLQMCDDAECQLCMRLMYEPVTTPCGHSFCKVCFGRAMDHSNKCPMCRTVLHVGRALACTISLKHLLERSFPDEYEARRREEAAAAASSAATDTDAAAPLPLFVMSLLLPGEQIALNIFEPRYRLMVRRCMEGSRRFGMATIDAQHRLSEVACEAEIVECQPLPDGRYYLEVVGRRRFRPIDSWEQDGYRMARPEFLSDEVPAAGSEDAQRLAEVAAEVEALADTLVERLRGLAQGRRGVADLLQRTGPKPVASDPEALSFWVANLCSSVLAGEGGLKRQLIATRQTVERLRSCRQLLQQLSSVSQSQGCTVM